MEVDTQGDAFFYAFPDAREAVAAAGKGRDVLRPGRSTSASASTPALRTWARRGTWARMSIWGRGSVPPATGGGCCYPRRYSPLRGPRARRAGSRRAPTKGLRETRPDLPARRRALPATEDDLKHEPAESGQLVHRPTGRGDSRDHLDPQWGPSRDPHRPWRLGEDPPLDRSGGRTRRRPQGWDLLGGTRADPRPERRRRRDRERRSAPRTASPTTSANGRCSSSSTTSSR